MDIKVDGTTYQLIQPMPSVAVLTSQNTASSGEAITVAFRGRLNSRSFGKGTRGVATTNKVFPLSDGAILLLAVATFADRDDQLYGGAIEPDEIVEGQPSADPALGDDPVVQAAIAWLNSQSSL